MPSEVEVKSAFLNNQSTLYPGLSATLRINSDYFELNELALYNSGDLAAIKYTTTSKTGDRKTAIRTVMY